MASRLIIQNVTGTTPYDVYVCNVFDVLCEYVGVLSGITTGKVFYLSSTFDNAPIILVKLIDANGCEIKKNLTCDDNCTFQVILFEESGYPCLFTPTPSNTPTVTPTNTVTPTVTPTLTPTNTSTNTPTLTPDGNFLLQENFYLVEQENISPIIIEFGPPTPTPTITPTNTSTPTVTPTNTTTQTNTPTQTQSATPTNTETSTNTPTPTQTQTVTPTNTTTVTPTPTQTPTITPSSSGGIVQDSLFMELDATNYVSGTWTDETGNGNNATINGATWSATDGGIFDLDGLNDTISIPHNSSLSLSTTTQRTIQVWVKFDSFPTGANRAIVFSKLSGDFSFDGYFGGPNLNGEIVVATNGNVAKTSTSVSTISLNTWYLFTFISQITSTSNTTKAYINTTEYITDANGGSTYSESNPLVLGYMPAPLTGLGNISYLDGKIGACYFYTKGLSAVEVTTNYDATKSKYGL